MSHSCGRQLVLRADDAGSARAANRAIGRACRTGTVTAVGFMAPAPAFADAAATLSPVLERVDVGVHATITAEWSTLRWGPLLPPHTVPSLCDENGFFYPRTELLYGRVLIAEVVAEIQAQIVRVREAGLVPDYLDAHMGIDDLPGVGAALADLAETEGLRYVPKQPRVLDPPDVEAGVTSLVERWLAELSVLPPGAYQLVLHPGETHSDMEVFQYEGLAPGVIAARRAAETEVLCDPRFMAGLCALRINPVRFTALE